MVLGTSLLIVYCEISLLKRFDIVKMFLTQYLQVEANLLCYNATISATEKSARWRRAIDMLDIGGWSALQLDNISFNAAMSACNSDDAWKDALQVFKDLKGRRLDVDIISFNSAISACEKSQRWRQALSLLEEALQTSLLFTTLQQAFVLLWRLLPVNRTRIIQQINTTSKKSPTGPTFHGPLNLGI